MLLEIRSYGYFSLIISPFSEIMETCRMVGNCIFSNVRRSQQLYCECFAHLKFNLWQWLLKSSVRRGNIFVDGFSLSIYGSKDLYHFLMVSCKWAKVNTIFLLAYYWLKMELRLNVKQFLSVRWAYLFDLHVDHADSKVKRENLLSNRIKNSCI